MRSALLSLTSPEHPRIRGENNTQASLDAIKGGTSPHTRGKLLQPAPEPIIDRNIPAYAGKTTNLHSENNTPAEHPRIRGENQTNATGTPHTQGTSPHTRGKLDPGRWTASTSRNIPAYAGKTNVHNARINTGYGTSPHTRGKLDRLRDRLEEHRNIPAYAGKTASAQSRMGESAGTSPHTRGKPRRAESRFCPYRNIPAYAGKTTVSSSRCTTPQEHPRIRGENMMLSLMKNTG